MPNGATTSAGAAQVGPKRSASLMIDTRDISQLLWPEYFAHSNQGTRARVLGVEVISMPAKNRANPLALAVLVCLAEQPRHPYEIATTLRQRMKHESVRLNYGSLYGVVESLERRGLIEAQETTRTGRHPERTTYAITDAGAEEAMQWLAELIAIPQKEYPQFMAGLSFLPALPPEEV